MSGTDFPESGSWPCSVLPLSSPPDGLLSSDVGDHGNANIEPSASRWFCRPGDNHCPGWFQRFSSAAAKLFNFGRENADLGWSHHINAVFMQDAGNAPFQVFRV